MLQLDLKAFF